MAVVAPRRLRQRGALARTRAPGEPGRLRICREILAEGRLPLLGVCLGHQGLAAAYGGHVRQVTPATAA
ncbi:gamma-glutamyl-gamma-aminobutyrate hydrolase family protein [Luedemannella flava]